VDLGEDHWTLIAPGGASWRAVHLGEVVHYADMLRDAGERGRWMSGQHGVRSMLMCPLLREGRGIGYIVIQRKEVQPFSDRQIAILKSFADQAVIAIENARLFKELQRKNAELAVASQHKSEFLANMSH